MRSLLQSVACETSGLLHRVYGPLLISWKNATTFRHCSRVDRIPTLDAIWNIVSCLNMEGLGGIPRKAAQLSTFAQ